VTGEQEVVGDMAGPRRMDRLTAQDLLMLWADDFGWPDDIGALRRCVSCPSDARRVGPAPL
jgi:hypothetical protein